MNTSGILHQNKWIRLITYVVFFLWKILLTS